MIGFTELAFGAALLAAVAGSAYATEPPPGYAPRQQTSYLPPPQEPKPSGGGNTQSTHFQKPPGYDQDRWMYPYGPGSGPRLQ